MDQNKRNLAWLNRRNISCGSLGDRYGLWEAKMADNVDNKSTQDTDDVPESGLLVESEELRRIRERCAGSMSDGGSSGRSDSNDNQNQMP